LVEYVYKRVIMDQKGERSRRGWAHDFRICKEIYRGKEKRGLLRVKIIASFCNHSVFSSFRTGLVQISIEDECLPTLMHSIHTSELT